MRPDTATELRQNRVAIKNWLRTLDELNASQADPETEAASWYWGLPEDDRIRLESDVDRFWSGDQDAEPIVEGPLGELIERFPNLFGAASSFRECEHGELAEEFRRLDQADPAWSAAFEGFLDSVDEHSFRRD